MICQCQSGPGAGGAGMLPSAAKLSSQGRAKWKTRLADRKVIKLTLCDCPFVMDSWPFFPAPRPRILRRGGWCRELQSGIIVRGRMQPPQLLHTNNRGTPARDTGVAGALNPVPADQTPGLASGPGWPLAPRPVLSQRTQRTWRSDRCSFVHDATRQQTQILLEVPNACVLWAPKQVTRSINRTGNALGDAYM